MEASQRTLDPNEALDAYLYGGLTLGQIATWSGVSRFTVWSALKQSVNMRRGADIRPFADTLVPAMRGIVEHDDPEYFLEGLQKKRAGRALHLLSERLGFLTPDGDTTPAGDWFYEQHAQVWIGSVDADTADLLRQRERARRAQNHSDRAETVGQLPIPANYTYA